MKVCRTDHTDRLLGDNWRCCLVVCTWHDPRQSTATTGLPTFTTACLFTYVSIMIIIQLLEMYLHSWAPFNRLHSRVQEFIFRCVHFSHSVYRLWSTCSYLRSDDLVLVGIKPLFANESLSPLPLNCKQTQRVTVYCVGFNVHATHNRSFQRRVFPDNQLHW